MAISLEGGSGKRHERPDPCRECGSAAWWNGTRRVSVVRKQGEAVEHVTDIVRRRARCSWKPCALRSWTLYEADSYPHRLFGLVVVASAVGAVVFAKATLEAAALVHRCSRRSVGRWKRWIGELADARALLLAFIDHFSRYILEARYSLHEDFAVLRCGFRHLLMVYGPFRRLYIDNGPSFQSARFHAACQNEALHIEVVHSKAYTSEGRGVCERFNRTVKEQFESEVRRREELLTLDELNAGWEAWVAERYHHDVHSEIGAAPFARFTMHAELRPAPDLACLDELLRLRKSARVHPKWSIVEVGGMRYLVTPSLRARRVQVLYDPLDPAYVLIEFDGRLVERAYPQKAGDTPPQLDPSPTPTTATDYLALLRRDYEARTQAELAAVNLRRRPVRPELSFRELQTLLTAARGKALAGAEHTELGACFRKLRPLDPDTTRQAVEAAQRRFGIGCHLRTYLEVVETALVRQRAKHGKGEKS